jgi:hypothetical protein
MKQARDPLYRRHRFPAEVISYAVWLYFRFPLSLRMVPAAPRAPRRHRVFLSQRGRRELSCTRAIPSRTEPGLSVNRECPKRLCVAIVREGEDLFH